MFRQESGVVLQRLVLLEISADDEAAVLVIRPDAQCFVDDLLGKFRAREEGTLRFAFGRSGIGKRGEIKKGHLLALLGGKLADVRLNEIFLFVNELCCPFGHQIP